MRTVIPLGMPRQSASRRQRLKTGRLDTVDADPYPAADDDDVPDNTKQADVQVEVFWRHKDGSKLPPDLWKRIRIRLQALDAAPSPLALPREWGAKRLAGDPDRWQITVGQPWRGRCNSGGRAAMRSKSGRATGTRSGWPAMHPGELLDDLLDTSKPTVADAARRMNVSRQTLHAIQGAGRGVTPEMALRLARLFGGSAELWLRLQERFDLESADRAIRGQLDRIEPLPEPQPA